MRRLLSALAGSALVLVPMSARALEPEVTSDSAAQFYDVRSPTGEQVISRRRFTTTLGVSVYDLIDQPENPTGPTLSFRARMRYDADYGGSAAESDVSNFGRLVPGFNRNQVDLMYGYVEGRRFLGGFLNFKLGRQYVTDSLGWWSFDGGLVKVNTPYYVSAEVYGGLEQRGGLALSTGRFERDGVWRGDRSGYDGTLWPSFQPNDIAPAYGVALESSGFTWLHGRLTYRRVYDEGSSNVSQFANGISQPVAYDGARISSERIGYAMEGTLAEIGGVKAGFAYDLYNVGFGNIFASIDGYVSKRLTLSLDYDFFKPMFDADSIWNFFMAMPMNDLGVRASWSATDHLNFAGGVRGRLYTLQTSDANPAPNPPSSPNNLGAQNYYPSSPFQAAGGGDLSGRWHFGEGAVGAHGAADFASNGERLGMDVFGERTLETRYILQGRAGVWQWNDQLRPDRDATSFQYVVGAGYKLFPRSSALAEFEHDINRLSAQRFRVMLYLTLAVTK